MFVIMWPDAPVWTLDQLRSTSPQFGFAYRGLVPGHGRSARTTPGWFACWLVDRGWAEVRYDDGRRLRATAGEWLLNAPMVSRLQSFEARAEILSLSFHLPAPPGFRPGDHLPLRLHAGEVDPMREAAERIVAELGGQSGLEGGRSSGDGLGLGRWLRLQRHLAEFVVAWYEAVFGEAGPSGDDLDHRVREAVTALALRPRMGPVPYDALTLRTGLGRVQLDRLFKDQLGRSPKQELDRLCLERVLRRLDDPGRALKTIAAELGFTDTSHLCRWFARQVGTSPQRYRRESAV